jgi:hypothetical protein
LGQFVLPVQQPPPGNPVFPEIEHFSLTQPPGLKSFAQIQKEQSQLSIAIGADTAVDPGMLAQLGDALGGRRNDRRVVWKT